MNKGKVKKTLVDLIQMIDLEAFSYLDPKKDELPYWPRMEASTAYFKAKGLLWTRTTNQVRELANDAAQIIEQFFDDEKFTVGEMLKNEGRWDLLETDEDGRIQYIKDEVLEEYDYRGPNNTSAVDALTEGVEKYFDPTSLPGVVDPKKYEMFGAVALNFLAQYVRSVKATYDYKTGDYAPRAGTNISTLEMEGLAAMVVSAMELACFGERLRSEERLQEKFEARLKQAVEKKDEEAKRLVGQATVEFAAAYKEEQKKERTAVALEKNRLRHQENHEAKALVLEEFGKNPTRFNTLEATGAHLVEYLQKIGIEKTQRTVVKWLSEAAQQKGLRFGYKKINTK